MLYIIKSRKNKAIRLVDCELPVRVMNAFLAVEDPAEQIIVLAEQADVVVKDAHIPGFKFPYFHKLFYVGKDSKRTYMIKERVPILDEIPINYLEDWVKDYMANVHFLGNEQAERLFLEGNKEKLDLFMEYLRKRQVTV